MGTAAAVSGDTVELLNVYAEWMSQRLALGQRAQVVVADAIPRAAHIPGIDPEPLEVTRVDGVAVIAISGFLSKHLGVFDRLFGAVSIGEIEAQVRAAAADQSINTTLLIIDSPGGSVAGMSDLADAIFEHRQIKPIAAYVSDLAASGGYYAASQADRIVADRDAIVGSIGVYVVLPDMSAAAAAEGVKVHVIRRGRFKGIETPGAAVSTEALEDLQRVVNELGDVFVADVARGRGARLPLPAVEALSDGRVHVGARAVELGLIDEIGTLTETLESLRAGSVFGRQARR